ncbi:hypothetical protein [Photorhabdus laumondii]|uniref:Uncharacterized protein n=1 Tax=Photorhabdus laumondii subsp. clarkei TaxID=2029685 RepID=A0A329V9X8_9GAMM|nr:hypothetical protein [Photorhabdus laumondii]PQQ37119.1 hypothetical protein C6H68_15550 [Photorhabdus luminescens]RAW81729.1 hypothetical protein CKY01_22655 [Photorhabdus laumondii subsp. clarkei]
MKSNDLPITKLKLSIAHHPIYSFSGQPSAHSISGWDLGQQQGIRQALINKITADLINKGCHEFCSDAKISHKWSHQAHEH